MSKLTKEDLDRLDKELAGCIIVHHEDPKKNTYVPDLLRLARLGLEVEEAQQAVKLTATQVSMAELEIRRDKLIQLGLWAEEHAIEVVKNTAHGMKAYNCSNQSIINGAKEALSKLPR